jgi:hypothetical protein
VQDGQGTGIVAIGAEIGIENDPLVHSEPASYPIPQSDKSC